MGDTENPVPGASIEKWKHRRLKLASDGVTLLDPWTHDPVGLILLPNGRRAAACCEVPRIEVRDYVCVDCGRVHPAVRDNLG